jgi:hypothetical protein
MHRTLPMRRMLPTRLTRHILPMHHTRLMPRIPRGLYEGRGRMR